MPISLPVCFALPASGSTGATERINYDPPTGYLPSLAPTHLFTLAVHLRQITFSFQIFAFINVVQHGD